MLSRFDDYPIHQTPEPIAHKMTGDRNAYDRYWFNGYDPDGAFYFGIGMALYPNRGIQDCAISVVHDGEQHSFHASRRASDEPTDTQVGPFRIEVLEPMRRLRVVLESNETGIECDLTFEARTACVEEGRQTLRSGVRVVMDATRFAQFGRWQGHIRFAGQTLAIDASRVYGTKDRSWGIRPLGEQEAGGAPGTKGPQIFFMWAPLQWKGRCTHFGIFEDAEGVPWHRDGSVIPFYDDPAGIPGAQDPATETMQSVEHRVVYAPGSRRAESAEITLLARDGTRHEISLEPLLCFRMKGIGYTNFKWGHGHWKGDLAIGAERWKCDELDPLALDNLHIQQVVRARMGDEVGAGVLEQICIGPHATSGFKEMLDGAPA